MTSIDDSLQLRCGVTINNRFGKSAMTEGLSGVNGVPAEAMNNLYRQWSQGGTGLLVTGNVMIDKRYLERIGNAILETDEYLAAFKALAQAATEAGNQCWMQISHPGRQCTRLVSMKPIAPSSEQLNLLWFFSRPREMNEDDIQDVINRYVNTAVLAKQAGFTGVQFHAAHGYLLSQFLSPITNKRTDQWGGALENRAKLLLTVVRQARDVLGDDFPISVKLNSKDFQQGGFSLEECAQVAAWLDEAGIDLLEISGGSYEAMAFFHGDEAQGSEPAKAESTRKREAFFVDYAETIAQSTQVPLMITGGFRSRDAMQQALDAGHTQMIGIARPYCVVPDLAQQMLQSKLDILPSYENNISLGSGYLSRASSNGVIRGLNNQAEAAWFYQQIINLSQHKAVNTRLGSNVALYKHLGRDIAENIKRKFN